jgi:hypothetical protein
MGIFGAAFIWDYFGWYDRNVLVNAWKESIVALFKGKGKGHAHNRPQGPKGVPGRLRPWIFLTFGTKRVVGRQPHAPAAFTPSGNPWYSFLEAE